MKPGVYDNIPEADYHGDKTSLSVSGAKKLLPPSCPARFKWDRDNGQAARPAYDFGHAAHAEVLGVGAELVVVQKVTRDKQRVDADTYDTKSAEAHAAEIRAEGKTPILRHQIEIVEGMAAALRAAPLASVLLNPERGKAEQSLYRVDLSTGVELRARFDWLPDAKDGRLTIVDYKTAASAEPDTFARSAARFKYHMQDAWYRDMARALGIARDVRLVFVAQEKVPPYLPSFIEYDDVALETGRRLNREAIDTYARCVAEDTWPGYSDGIELISLPMWATDDIDLEVA